MKKPYSPSVPDEPFLIQELRDDPAFAAAYLKLSFEEATDEEGRHILLKVMKRIAEAQGISNVAKAAGIPRESLSRALSPKGNPRLDTLVAIVNALGLRMTVEPPR